MKGKEKVRFLSLKDKINDKPIFKMNNSITFQPGIVAIVTYLASKCLRIDGEVTQPLTRVHFYICAGRRNSSMLSGVMTQYVAVGYVLEKAAGHLALAL